VDLRYNQRKCPGSLKTWGFLLWIIAPGSAWAQEAPCPDLGESILRISSDVEDVELERALDNSKAALEALECQSEPVSAMALTQLLQLIGVVHLYADDIESATESFAWAVNSSPTMNLSESYGEEAIGIYEAAQANAFSAEAASLTVTGDVEAWVNGNPLTLGAPQTLLPGAHLVQWRRRSQPMSARIIELLEGEPRVLPLGPVVELPPELAPEATTEISLPRPASNANRWLFMGTGLASIAGGSFLVVLASRSHELFESEMDPDDLPELQTRTNALASTGLVLVAGGLAVGSFSFTLSQSF
jgi:hypothetical protein